MSRSALLGLLLAACGASRSSSSAPPSAVANEPAAAPAPTEAAPARLSGGRKMMGFAIENGELVVEPVTYATGKAEILDESREVLDYVADFLATRTDVTLVRVEVHTDATGSSTFNARISGERALAVARWLVHERVIDCRRLIPVGFGETRPIADNATAEGKGANRRTVFALAALRGKPIGGLPVEGGGVVAGDPCR